MPSVITPGLRYADAVAAIAFLCEAFGFARHAVYADDAEAYPPYRSGRSASSDHA